MIGKGDLLDGLYVIGAGLYSFGNKNGTCKDAVTIANVVVSRNTWHNRIGHISCEKLDKLNGLLKFPATDKRTKSDPCLVCPLAK